jgi:hypothetical protein
MRLPAMGKFGDFSLVFQIEFAKLTGEEKWKT